MDVFTLLIYDLFNEAVNSLNYILWRVNVTITNESKVK